MTTTAPMTPGEQRSYAIPGTSAVAFVQRHHAGHYSVWIGQGGRVDEWAATFADAATASAEYRRAIHAFHAHGSAAGIDRRRDALAVELSAQHARMARRMHNRDRIDAIEAELADLESFADRSLARQLLASLAA